MANIEKILIDYLMPLLPDVTVSSDVPNPRPEKLVTVERTGGGADSIVLDRPQVMIQCWAKTRLDAYHLAADVDHLVSEIDNLELCDIVRTGLYNYPDEHGNQRYRITYQIIAYR